MKHLITKDKMSKTTNVIVLIQLFISFILVISCEKPSNTNNIEDIFGINVSVRHPNANMPAKSDPDAWLCFDTRADYEAAIDLLAEDESLYSDFEDALGFISMRQVLTEEQRDSIEISDDLLATLLNRNGVIQIGNYLFNINVLRDSTTVFDVLSEEIIMTLSSDEEIFPHYRRR